MGLTKLIAEYIHDNLQAGKIDHTIHDLVKQRVFGLGCGYADGNDADKQSQDPEQICRQFPKARIEVRLDGGFAQPELLDWLDSWEKVMDLGYLVVMAGNSRLESCSAGGSGTGNGAVSYQISANPSTTL